MKNTTPFDISRLMSAFAPIPVEPLLRRNILILARAYVKAADVKISTFSRYAHGDGPAIDKLAAADRGGPDATISLTKYDQIIRWAWDHWPEHEPWPDIWQPLDLSEVSPRQKARKKR